MLNFHDFNIQMLADFFSAHPYSAGIFTFIIVFIEAMAVIGVIVPGAITMPAIGFLIGSAIIPAGSTFLYGIAGAITGDCLSYWLGIYFQNRVHRIWPFTRWPSLLVRAEKFFHSHGGKSVFLGRFVGPTRAMIPMVAGMLKMPLSRFLFAAIPSATIWAVGYMIPGVLLGALSLELPAKVATEFTLWALLALIVLWLIIWLLNHYFRQICQMLDYYIKHCWKYCQKHSELSWFTKMLSDPKEPDNHQQLTLVVAAAFVFVLFLVILHQVLISGILVDFSRSIYYLLTSLRTEKLDHIFVVCTLLGDAPMLITASGILFLWLLWKRYWYVAAHWLGIMALSGAVIGGMKFFMYSPRPGGISFDKITSLFPGDHTALVLSINDFLNMFTSSFPSAHVTLTLSFYGFLSVVIARELKVSKRYIAYMTSGILVGVIAFSRIYLGAHWVVDILGGILLGLLVVLIVTVSYRRRHVLHFHVYKFILVASSVFIIVWLGYSAVMFNKKVHEYTLIWPHSVVTFNQVITGKIETPLYRLNRLGKPIEVFNVIYVGNLATISQALSKEGWEYKPEAIDLQGMIKNFSANLSVFPQLYQNKKMALSLTKKTASDGTISILRLWSSNIDLKDSKLPLWIGVVEYRHTETATVFSLSKLKDKPVFNGATEFLSSYLGKGFYLWKKDYLLEQQPVEMRQLNWNGELLVIREKKTNLKSM